MRSSADRRGVASHESMAGLRLRTAASGGHSWPDRRRAPRWRRIVLRRSSRTTARKSQPSLAQRQKMSAPPRPAPAIRPEILRHEVRRDGPRVLAVRRRCDAPFWPRGRLVFVRAPAADVSVRHADRPAPHLARWHRDPAQASVSASIDPRPDPSRSPASSAAALNFDRASPVHPSRLSDRYKPLAPVRACLVIAPFTTSWTVASGRPFSAAWRM